MAWFRVAAVGCCLAIATAGPQGSAAEELASFAPGPAPSAVVTSNSPGESMPATATAETAEAKDSNPAACERSHAVNLPVIKAFLRPPTNNPLDSYTYIAGIKCREKGFLKQDTMIQSGIKEFEELANKGLRMEFTYFPDMTWSSFGPPAYSAMYVTSMDLYTGQTGVLWQNGQVHLTGSGWNGNAYNSPANQSFKAEGVPPLNNWRLFELWYGHKLSPQLELRVGKIYPWVKFASHQTSGIFQNLGFDYPGLYGTTQFTGNFLPYAAAPLGAQLSYNPNSHHQFLLHIADGKDDGSGGYKIALSDLSLSPEDGVEIIAEYAYLDHSTDPKKLPGYYKIGFQGNTGQFFNFRTGNTENGSYGGYVTLEKMLYAEPNTEIPRSQGLMGFMKFSGTSGTNTVVNLVTSAGLSYAGLFPGRDSDMAGIGVAYSQFNSYAASFYANSLGLQPSTGETALEAVYLAQLTPWLMVIGSYQYVITPSSMGATNPAIPSGHVVLLNTRISF